MIADAPENCSSSRNDNYGYDVSQKLLPDHNSPQTSRRVSCFSATDVNNWSTFWILFRLTQDFVGHGRGIALAECDVLHEVT